VFFVGVTPIALALRLLRIDILHLRRDPAAATYWRGRKASPPDNLFSQS
jgi:hypothetical protein